MTRIRPPEAVLRKLYEVENKSPKEIAGLFNTDVRNVSKWFSVYGIQNRNTRHAEALRAITREQWCEWYLDRKMNTVAIANLVNATHRTVLNILIRHEIPIRSNSEAQLLNFGTADIDNMRLKELYESGMTQQEIGERVGLTQAAVRRRLESVGTEMRSRAHPGASNGMFGRTHTPEAREKIRQASQRQFSDQDARTRHAILTCEQIQSGRTGKAFNKLETRVAILFNRQKVRYEQQFRLGRFLFDFYLPDTHELVEVHGTFWHADPRRYHDRDHLSAIQVRNLENDAKKKARALRDGYNYRVIWEMDVPAKLDFPPPPPLMYHDT